MARGALKRQSTTPALAASPVALCRVHPAALPGRRSGTDNGRAGVRMSEPIDDLDRNASSQRGDRGPRLDSWKEIAAHLGRDVRTVQRWERAEGLPVHRHQHDKLGSVFAFRDELEAWRTGRSVRHGEPPPGQNLDSDTRSEPADPVPAGGATDLPSGPPALAGPAGRAWRRTRQIAALAALVVAAVGAWLVLRPQMPGTPATPPTITSIVVLPLDNLSSDATQDFFAAGLTEEITNRLAQLTRLRVVSRTSAISLRDRKLPVASIASELGIDAVVEGSVRREAGRVRIAVQLIHAPSDTHLWARDFEGDADASWRLQIEIAEAVAAEIRVQSTPQERARLSATLTVAPAARDEYMLGRFLLWRLVGDDQRVRAMAHFRRAIELQPDYAAPYAALAHAWWMRGAFGPLSLRDVATPAREAAMAALARDDGNAEAYAALAYVQGLFDWEWDQAQITIRKAVTLEPSNVDARYVHGLLLMALGRLDAAAEELDAAVALDPLSAQVHSTHGRVLYRARRFDDARRHLERSLELEPRSTTTLARLAVVLEQQQRYGEALAAVDAIDQLLGDARPSSALRARILATAGQVPAARQLLAALPPNAPLRAEVLAALGDRDAALASLSRALDGRESWLPFIKSDPVFDGLRGDLRWAAVLQRMNLQ